MSHTCHAEACTKVIPPRLLMCARHWALVPSAWQRIVWREYRPGQEKDKRPSAQYLLVQAIVVAIVACRDRAWTPAQAEAHILERTELVWKSLDRAWVQALPLVDLTRLG